MSIGFAGDEGPYARAEVADLFVSFGSEGEKGCGESVGFSSGGEDHHGQDGAVRGLAGARIYDVAESLAGGLEELAMNPGDGHGFVFEFDSGEDLIEAVGGRLEFPLTPALSFREMEILGA